MAEGPDVPVQLEICVDTVDGAVAAERGGAHRIELCTGLEMGGLTPSVGLLDATREVCSLPLMVLVRPRPGDFLYSRAEHEVMLRDIERIKAGGAAGVVVGVLRRNGRVDVERLADLVAAAAPLPITFHRAFDMSRDPRESLADLMEQNIARVLTSGQRASAAEGVPVLADLVRRAAGQLSILPGGGIRPHNIAEIVRRTRVHEVHASARELHESAMEFRNEKCHLGSDSEGREYARRVTSSEQVRSMVQQLQGAR